MPVLAECHPQGQHTEDILQHGYHYRIHPALHKLDHPEKSYTCPHDRPLKYSLPFSYRKQVPLHCLGLHRHKGNSPPHRQGNLHLLLLLHKESHRNMLRMTQFLILHLMPALRQATDLRAYINLKKSLIFVVSFSLLLFSLIFQSCVTRLG